MTNRVQTLRSNVPGNRPTGRLPGELYVNWADNQFGSINPSNTAQDLIAVRFFSSTANYTQGSYVVQSGGLYSAKSAITAGAFNPTQWAQVGGAVTVSDTVPTLPSNGQLWYDSVGGQLYVYYTDQNTSQWVIAVNSPVSSTVNIGTTAPPNPVTGQLWFDGNGQQLYIWYDDGNTKQWVPTTNQMGGGYLPLSGGTMTGVLNAPQGISAPQAMGDNRLINGDMKIDQRGVASSGGATTSGYTADRWYYAGSQTGKGTWSRQPAGPGGVALGFQYYLNLAATTAYTPAAADYFQFFQPIEADMIGDLGWGTAAAKPVTLSFIAGANGVYGTFSGAIRNYACTRAYPFTFSLPDANWHNFAITIPGDTAGSWVLSGSSGGMIVGFDFGCGANYRSPAGVWASGNYPGANGAVQLIATQGASFQLALVKLEVGNIATPFNQQSLAKSLIDCQRYYQKLGGTSGVEFILQGYTSLAASLGASFAYNTVMRAVPTVTKMGVTWQINNVQSVSFYPGLWGMGMSINTPGAGQTNYYSTDNTDYIALSAEL